MVLQLVEQVRDGIAKSSPPSPASSGTGRLFVLRREIYAAVQRAFAQHRILPTGRGVKVHLEVAGGMQVQQPRGPDVHVLELSQGGRRLMDAVALP